MSYNLHEEKPSSRPAPRDENALTFSCALAALACYLPLQAKRPVPRTRRGSPADGAAATGDSGETGVGRKRQRTQPWETEYQKIWKTVTDLGAEQFTGRDKKEYEARKIVERGGRVRSDR